ATRRGRGERRSWRPRSRPLPRAGRGPRLRTGPRLADSTDPLGRGLPPDEADARNALEIVLDAHESPRRPRQDLRAHGLGLPEADLEHEQSAGCEDGRYAREEL